MGYDLSFALHRDEPLSAGELDELTDHLRTWRRKIIGYDWRVRSEHVAGDMIAWGTLRPTRGKPNVSDQGGYLSDVVDHLHEALAEVRDLIRGAKLLFGDDFGALAWKNLGFTYDKQAAHPDIPYRDIESWTSLAAERALPEGKSAKPPPKPKKKADAREALAGATRDQLIPIVLAPLNKQVRDIDRTAAIELLAADPDPAIVALFVHRLRNDGFERKWTASLLRTLAATPHRCHWATALLAFDRKYPGAAALVFATVDDTAIPHLLRIRVDPAWSSLALRALGELDSDGARDAKRQLLDKVRASLTDADVVDAIIAASPAQATAALDGKASKLPKPSRTGDLMPDHKPELWQLEESWLARFGY